MRIVEVFRAKIDNCAACGETHDGQVVYKAIVPAGNAEGMYQHGTHEAFACPNRDYTVVVFRKDEKSP